MAIFVYKNPQFVDIFFCKNLRMKRLEIKSVFFPTSETSNLPDSSSGSTAAKKAPASSALSTGFVLLPVQGLVFGLRIIYSFLFITVDFPRVYFLGLKFMGKKLCNVVVF